MLLPEGAGRAHRVEPGDARGEAQAGGEQPQVHGAGAEGVATETCLARPRHGDARAPRDLGAAVGVQAAPRGDVLRHRAHGGHVLPRGGVGGGREDEGLLPREPREGLLHAQRQAEGAVHEAVQEGRMGPDRVERPPRRVRRRGALEVRRGAAVLLRAGGEPALGAVPRQGPARAEQVHRHRPAPVDLHDGGRGGGEGHEGGPRVRDEAQGRPAEGARMPEGEGCSQQRCRGGARLPQLQCVLPPDQAQGQGGTARLRRGGLRRATLEVDGGAAREAGAAPRGGRQVRGRGRGARVGRGRRERRLGRGRARVEEGGAAMT